MVRVKKGKAAHKRRKNVLKNAKGLRWGRKSKFALAKDALLHAWSYSYRDRRNKKRDIRQNWNIQINALSREFGLPYSKLIHGLKLKNIELDRKILSSIAKTNPKIFEKIVEEAKK
jgi:large subunit ribosomal protein L20